jgi:hypothetical protein
MNTDNTDQATAIDKIVKGEKPKSLKHGGEEEPEEMSWMADNCVPLCLLCPFVVDGFLPPWHSRRFWQLFLICVYPRQSAVNSCFSSV